MKVAAFLLAAMMLSACGKTHGTQANRDGSTLVIADTFEPSTLNPLLIQGDAAEVLDSFIFSHLLATDAAGQLVPEVATAVPTQRNGGISADGLRVTYHLRHDVKWQDGAALTSADCAFTWRAIMNPANDVVSRDGYDQIASVSTPDPYTLVLRLLRPYASITGAFLASNANYPILPAHLLAKSTNLNQAPFNAAPIGSGPYRLVDWERADHLMLIANPAFFLGRPHIRRIIVRFVPSGSTEINQLRTHEIDAVLLIDPSLREEARSLHGYRVLVTRASGITTLMFNMESAPTSSLYMRKAISMAVDVPQIVRNISGGDFTPGGALRGIFGWAYVPVARLPYDRRAAMRLLDEHGWRVGADGIRTKNGRALSVDLIISNDRQANERMATMVQQDLRAVGVDASIRGFTPLQYGAPASSGGPVRAGRFSIALILMFGDTGPDASETYACDQRAPFGANFERLCDPQIDTMLTEIKRTYDPTVQLRDAAIIQHKLHELAAQIDLYQTRRYSVIPVALSGYAPTPANPYNAAWRWSLRPTNQVVR